MKPYENTPAPLELGPWATRAMMLYGVNVNLQRAIPSIVDGLKPIHRRIIYSIYKNNGWNYVTVATSVGQTIHYSPHGDLGLKDTYAGLAQPFSNNIPLITAKGNCGTPVSGKDAAAARYWSVRLSDFTKDVLFDEFDGRVNMRPNYDNTAVEPITFPAKFPIILLNGSNGIGYTLSSDCLPYNLNEIADATIKLLKNPRATIHLVPDSPTGCDIIVNSDTSFTMQSSYEIDNINYTITFKNTPHGEYLDKIDEELCKIQMSPQQIREIISADDESDLIEGKIRYVVRCKPGNMYKVLNTLFKRVRGFRAPLSTLNVNVVDTGFRMRKLQPTQILLRWIANRLREKRAYYLRELVDKTTERNMLEGKIFMLSPENLNKTIKVFRSCNARDEIIPALVDAYKEKITTSQANYIAELHVYQLTNGEYLKSKEQLTKVDDRITEIRSIVDSPDKIKDVIADEIRTIKNKYGYPRRSKIINPKSSNVTNVNIVQILTDGSVMFNDTENPEHLASDITPITGDDVCLIDELGQFLWVNVMSVEHNKPVTLTSIGRQQMGKCIAAVSNRDHDIVLLSNKGRIKFMPIDKIPSNQSRKPLVPLDADETIVSVLDISDPTQDLLIYTSDGLGKRFKVSDLNRVMSVDAQGQNLITGHVVAGIFPINPNKPWLVYVTRLARIRVNHQKFLGTGKKFGDVKPIIKLSPQDDLIAVFCTEKDKSITLYHADGRVTTVNIDSIEPSTMSMPPTKPKHVPAVKVLRATLS
jgi:DNA gyrase/topoisomerase IV subunit A